jgi:hypothetical protein
MNPSQDELSPWAAARALDQTSSEAPSVFTTLGPSTPTPLGVAVSLHEVLASGEEYHIEGRQVRMPTCLLRILVIVCVL